MDVFKRARPQTSHLKYGANDEHDESNPNPELNLDIFIDEEHGEEKNENEEEIPDGDSTTIDDIPFSGDGLDLEEDPNWDIPDLDRN